MRKIFPSVLLAILIMAALMLLIGPGRIWSMIAGPADLGPVEFATLRKSDKPNAYLICSKILCTSYVPDMESPVFDVDAGTLKTMGLSVWAAEPGVTIVDNPKEGLMVRFVQRTPYLKFPDTISVRFIPVSAGKSTLAIYSRSQIGCSDLGANEKRVKHWLSLLDQAKQ